MYREYVYLRDVTLINLILSFSRSETLHAKMYSCLHFMASENKNSKKALFRNVGGGDDFEYVSMRAIHDMPDALPI